jgi:hypothetical protein
MADFPSDPLTDTTEESTKDALEADAMIVVLEEN